MAGQDKSHQDEREYGGGAGGAADGVGEESAGRGRRRKASAAPPLLELLGSLELESSVVALVVLRLRVFSLAELAELWCVSVRFLWSEVNRGRLRLTNRIGSKNPRVTFAEAVRYLASTSIQDES